MTRKTKTRICVYVALGVVVALFFLHPYGRQMVFGPRVHGQPFAYWQDRYRHAALGSGQQGAITLKLLGFIGLKHSDPYLRDDPEMLPVLLSLLDDSSPAVRASLCPWLAKHLDSPQASDGLLGLLDDTMPKVRAAAALALLQLKLPYEPALAKLRDRLADEDPLCRVRAGYAVCRIEKRPDKDAVAVLRSGLKVNDISNMRQRSQSSACLEAVKYLCFLSNDSPEFVAEIADALRENPQLHRYAMIALMDVGPVATPVLVQSLSDADPEIRVDAAHILGRLGPPAEAALPALARALDDSDLSVRGAAANALSNISPERHPPKKKTLSK